MTRKAALLLLALNALISAGLIASHALWFAQTSNLPFAILDVAELYRLKEKEITTLLMKQDATEQDRRRALERTQSFGTELASLIERLPDECRCMVVARGAVVGPSHRLQDLTPLARQRLGI